MNPALRGSIAVLLLRVMTGVAFMIHGWGKIQNPLHWMDAFPGHPPSFVQALPAVAEFCGGLGVALGLLTPIACFGLFCTMAVAIYVHVSHGDPFIAQGGPGWELACVFLVSATVIALLGPGRYSLDQRLLGQKPRTDY